MIIENPEVTLEEEGHGFPEEVRETGMLMWNIISTVHGDDGKQYWINTTLGTHKSVDGLEGAMDIWTIGVSWETGKVVQLPNTVYKVADFPETTFMGLFARPTGELTIGRSKNEVAVDLGGYHITCKDDKTWHFNIEDKEQGIKAEWVHYGIGYPKWYGKEKPGQFTPHVIIYGYAWSGIIEGTLTIEGRKVGIKGAGLRERLYGVDQSAAEEGGWMEWMWFHFDELFGGVDEEKLSKHKEVSLYLLDEKQYLPAGSFNIEHHDWAWLKPLGAFIPTRYKVTIETEVGVLEMAANVVGCTLWGVTGEVPDTPAVSLHWDKVVGTFNYKDGRKKTLTNGLGGTLIRLWKPYPSITIPKLAGA